MTLRTKVILTAMIAAIVVAHVFLWRSGMETNMKLLFTAINGAGWAIVLGPIFLVNRWLAAVEQENAKRDDVP